MAHVIEPATSGRAKCRGCGKRIEKGELRLGERLPNPFAEGEMTHWYHVVCGAYKRPAPALEALAETSETVEDAERIAAEVRLGVEHRRLPRVDGAQRAPTGRARCRSCRETIDKQAWRISLVYFEDGRFQPSGFVHARCAPAYFGTTELLPRVRHFSPELDDEAAGELRAEIDRS